MIARNLLRTYPSISRKGDVERLCLKYSYQPFRVRFRSAMMYLMLLPLVRLVLAWIVSFSFLTLFLRGHRAPSRAGLIV
jgi:hypothetical protein